jgi:hypothetical protein
MLARAVLARRTPLLARASAAPAARLYHENIIDHYESPRNVGSLDKKDPQVGTGLVGAPACGDVMKLQMRVGADGRVEEAVFKVRFSRCAPLSLPAHHPAHPGAALMSSASACCADLWVRLSDSQLVVRDRVAQGQDA